MREPLATEPLNMQELLAKEPLNMQEPLATEPLNMQELLAKEPLNMQEPLATEPLTMQVLSRSRTPGTATAGCFPKRAAAARRHPREPEGGGRLGWSHSAGRNASIHSGHSLSSPRAALQEPLLWVARVSTTWHRPQRNDIS